jgi:hypothetical protein
MHNERTGAAAVLAGCLLLAGAGHTGEPCLSLDGLVRMDRCELERLYSCARPGPIPVGCTRGKAIPCPGTVFAGPASKLMGLAWKGKQFDPCDATMINRWCNKTSRPAKVYIGPSWFDGKEAIILDYCGMSDKWGDVRDEIREVCPGLYLGMMFKRRCPEPKFVRFFALEAEQPGCE